MDSILFSSFVFVSIIIILYLLFSVHFFSIDPTFYIDGAECGTIKLSGSNNGYGITIQGTGGNGAYINGKLYVNGEAQCSTLSTSSIISSGYSGLNTSVNVTTPSGTKGMTFKNGVLTNVY